MKTKLFLSLAAVAALVFTGWNTTPQQKVAIGVYAAGEAYAVGALADNPSVLPFLQDVAAKLPKLNTGELTAKDLGVFSGELTILRLGAVDLEKVDPANAEKYAQVDSFLAGVIAGSSALNGGKTPTVNDAIATAALTQLANGISDGILF